MQKQLSLVELAMYGYVPARVNKGSWLEQTFGKKSEVNNNEYTGQPDQDKELQAGGRSAEDTGRDSGL